MDLFNWLKSLFIWKKPPLHDSFQRYEQLGIALYKDIPHDDEAWGSYTHIGERLNELKYTWQPQSTKQ